MKRFLIVVALFLCISTCMNAQYVRPDNVPPGQPEPVQKPNDFWSHTSVGGNLSLEFGSLTYVVLAPLLNYHLNDNFVIGVGPYYQYLSENDQYGTFSTSVYGGRVVGMFFLPGHLSKLFLQGEYDLLDVPDLYSYTNDKRVSVGIPLVGLGYRQPAGDKCYFTLAVLFDLSNSPLSPYYIGPNSYIPIIFSGIDIGF